MTEIIALGVLIYQTRIHDRSGKYKKEPINVAVRAVAYVAMAVYAVLLMYGCARAIDTI